MCSLNPAERPWTHGRRVRQERRKQADGSDTQEGEETRSSQEAAAGSWAAFSPSRRTRDRGRRHGDHQSIDTGRRAGRRAAGQCECWGLFARAAGNNMGRTHRASRAGRASLVQRARNQGARPWQRPIYRQRGGELPSVQCAWGRRTAQGRWHMLSHRAEARSRILLGGSVRCLQLHRPRMGSEALWT